VIHLGAGEAETIEWSLRHPDFMAILDDRAARRTAEALGVKCAGTLRVLFEASKRNLIVSFPEAVERLRAAGLYCDQQTIAMVSRTR
jgi:predicted nucleic acid-binding protein